MRMRITAAATAGIKIFLLRKGVTSSQDFRKSKRPGLSFRWIPLSTFSHTHGKVSFSAASSTGLLIRILRFCIESKAIRQAGQSGRWSSTRDLSFWVTSWSKYFSKSLDMEEHSLFTLPPPFHIIFQQFLNFLPPVVEAGHHRSDGGSCGLRDLPVRESLGFSEDKNCLLVRRKLIHCPFHSCF